MITVREQLHAWKRVIFALFLRELQSKFNDKFGLSWAFVEPFVFVFVLSFARSFVSGGDVHSIPLFVFMMIGLMGLQSFLTGMGAVSNSIKKNKPLYAFRQVHPISAVLTSGLLEFTIKLGVLVLMALALFLLHQTFAIANPLLLITIYLSLWILTISVGMLFAIAASFVAEVDKVKAMLQRPLLFISCVFFSLQDIPEQYWHWFTWNPLVHAIELARYACFETYGNNGVSLNYLIGVTIVTLFFSLAAYHITWKRLLAR
ncbi:ABC transporter [Alteromonas aestuariivivens]|uniref:Transport permease protein n=1 Tax=Alteromonas aestuariivivens TaxID=1938339 RepID=A0A3D8M406_9ALTE|nr:ABC transporter permease [Alteromonas aestuariivivens]RDV24371.1 ABC transporter [Alteromonas aestuariivivens]